MEGKKNQTLIEKQDESKIGNNFYPFGFRSKKWYKMFLASLYLLIMIFALVSVILADGVVKDASTYDMLIYKTSQIMVIFAFVAPYLILSNIFGWRGKLPLYRKHKLISTTLAIVIAIFVFGLIGGQISSLHTNDYEKAYDDRNVIEVKK